MTSLLGTVPHVKLDPDQEPISLTKEDDVGLVFKDEGSDGDLSSYDDEDAKV